jgi:hypothetical protein
MLEIASGLLWVTVMLSCIFSALLGIVAVLSGSVEEQKRTNDISEHMAKIMEGGE